MNPREFFYTSHSPITTNMVILHMDKMTRRLHKGAFAIYLGLFSPN